MSTATTSTPAPAPVSALALTEALARALRLGLAEDEVDLMLEVTGDLTHNVVGGCDYAWDSRTVLVSLADLGCGVSALALCGECSFTDVMLVSNPERLAEDRGFYHEELSGLEACVAEVSADLLAFEDLDPTRPDFVLGKASELLHVTQDLACQFPSLWIYADRVTKQLASSREAGVLKSCWEEHLMDRVLGPLRRELAGLAPLASLGPVLQAAQEAYLRAAEEELSKGHALVLLAHGGDLGALLELELSALKLPRTGVSVVSRLALAHFKALESAGVGVTVLDSFELADVPEASVLEALDAILTPAMGSLAYAYSAACEL